MEETKRPKLGKRKRDLEADIEMSSSDDENKMSKAVRGSKSKSNMKMTAE